MSSPAIEGDGGASMDHISDLTDDLLLHVLRFLSDDARDVVCTSALSTRWCHLWTRAPVLCLINRDRNGRSAKWDDPRFNDFLHNVLAGRTDAQADIDTLELYTLLWPGKSQADVWLRHAMRLTVSSLAFWVSVPRDRSMFTMPRHLLPGSTRLKKMSLDLDHAALLLPPTVHFLALTELTLHNIWFSDDDGPRLGHLLSSPSCCPRLQKLTLWSLNGLHDLRLDGEALETLDLDHLEVRRLDVNAPRLSELQLGSDFMHYGDNEHTIERHRLGARAEETGIHPHARRQPVRTPASHHSTTAAMRPGRPTPLTPTCFRSRSLKNDMISLEHLQEVKLCGFSGQEQCCLDILDLLTSVPALDKMIVTAKTSMGGWGRNKIVLAKSLESSLPRGRGKWTACSATDDATVTMEYKWIPN
ncbi:unnamed protein product [Alopecurus aequalis]